MTPPSELARALSGRQERFCFLPGSRSSFEFTGGFDVSHMATLQMSSFGGSDIVVSPPDGASREEPRPTEYEYELDPNIVYRITVSVSDIDLGSANLGVLGNGSQLQHVETGNLLALARGWSALADQVTARRGLPARRFLFRGSDSALYIRHFVFGGRVLLGILPDLVSD